MVYYFEHRNKLKYKTSIDNKYISMQRRTTNKSFSLNPVADKSLVNQWLDVDNALNIVCGQIAGRAKLEAEGRVGETLRRAAITIYHGEGSY